MDPEYKPPAIETRQVYGIHLQQRRNDAKIDASLFKNIVSQNKEVRSLTKNFLIDCLFVFRTLSFRNPGSST